ncbi:Serine/threonine-protein phosphatase PP1 [Tritrichomonas foetus]|uniref:Serine/threonine-protein phosphatase n=1 Tax=Tritrichomonas foetus TaxID=1144522 RepID=A0A1J4KHH5_9EUKA|nr:Serine/threonine-protein phosphatase PP1 [Tritrichomonas foetus]|eukprot:OHT09110.1 Serine/threonine-protein phosphatase PP1 [Tritrichomonas foetus]
MEEKRTFNKIYQCYRTLLSLDVSEYESEKSRLVFPVVPIPILTELCASVCRTVMGEPVMLKLKGEYIVVGDLHGQILDLFRILRKFGHPPKRNYIFLGDIVDRGEFSTETVILIFLMKALWPENIYIIRGNHEFSDLWPSCGFLRELETIYGEAQVSPIFANVFAYLPLTAIVNDKYLCVHGGIGPKTPGIEQLEKIQRPCFSFLSEPVLSIVWSDPSEKVQDFQPSTRGTGYLYGASSLKTYLDSQNLELLIRGHECIDKGVEFCLNNRCVTVFSASNYCGVAMNQAGVLILKPEVEPESVVMNSLRWIKRTSASYLGSSSETSFFLSSKPTKLKSASQQSFPTLKQNISAKNSLLMNNGNSSSPNSPPGRTTPKLAKLAIQQPSSIPAEFLRPRNYSLKSC